MPAQTCICVYSETYLSTGQWSADKASTFKPDTNDGYGGTKPHMDQVPCPQDYRLFGLLSAGVREHTWQWSFEPKGLPQDMSPEIRQLADYWNGEGTAHHHSWLTLHELMTRSMDLLVDQHEEAWSLEAQLLLLIRKLVTAPEQEIPYCNRRIVFWFID